MGLNHDHASAFGGRNCYWWLKLCGQSRYNFFSNQKFIRSSSKVHQGTALRMQDTTVISSAISKSSKNLPRSPESIPSVLRRSRHGPSPHSSTKKKRRRFRNTTWGRWIKTVLAWQPRGHKRIGRPKCCWDSMTTNFWRLINFPIVQLILAYGV